MTAPESDPNRSRFARIRRANGFNTTWPSEYEVWAGRKSKSSNSDLGSSAAIGAVYREGFERVFSSLALGEVGIVVSREVSRVARSDKDWCRLVEVCQIFGTLIGDEQQVFDLSYLDDLLVLGIKGTLSVVELKVLRQRRQGRNPSPPR